MALSDEIRIRKRNLRRDMKEAEKSHMPDSNAASEIIWAKVELSPEFLGAKTILIYMDIDGEVRTREFMRLWSSRKRFVLPLVSGDRLELREYSEDKLVRGFKGILEPGSGAPSVRNDEIDLAIVPGVAFTSDGRRLGRGSGFYDGLLPELHCPKLGVGYRFRLLEDIPVAPWDQRVDKVFTD